MQYQAYHGEEDSLEGGSLIDFRNVLSENSWQFAVR